MTSRLEQWLQTLPSLTPGDSSEIHIDVLSQEYQTAFSWIQGTPKCLEEANTYVRLHCPQGVTCAAFALVGGKNYLGVNYQSCADLSLEFGLTPPSLYYFGGNAIPWHNSVHPFRQVDLSDFPADLRRWVLLHLEYLYGNEPEYRRSLWVVPRLAMRGRGQST